jgi:molybdate transport system substrate-binding protein
MNNRAENAPLTVLCTNGLKSVFLETGEQLSSKTGVSFSAEYGSTKKFTDRVAEGDDPDVVILTDEAIDTLIGHGKLSQGRTDLAKSFIGVAVRKGTPKPDIGSVPAFIATLRAARAISRSKMGASGLHIEAVLKKLGIAEELSPRIKIYDGYAAQACADGEVDIAIQQISELMPVAGLEIVGPLPDELQKMTMFSAGIGAGTPRRSAAEKFIGYIKNGERAGLLRAHGLEPA